MSNSEGVFILRALQVPIAVAPAYALSAYLLKKCDENDTSLGAAGVHLLSLLLSPIDTAIQLVVTPIWAVLDELFSNKTCGNWACTIFAIPLKLAYVAITTPIVAICHLFWRIFEPHSINGNELSYDVNNRMTWFLNSLSPEKPIDRTDMHAVFPTTLERDYQESITRLVLPKLREAGYKHLYVIDQNDIPQHAGAYADATLANKEHFILMVNLKIDRNGEPNMTNRAYTSLKVRRGWNSATPADGQGQFEYMTKNDLFCLYNYLPLCVAQKLDALVAKSQLAATGTDS